MVRLTKLLRGLDGFADDKWVCVSANIQRRMLARLRARPGRVVSRPCRRPHPMISPPAAAAQGIPVRVGPRDAGYRVRRGARCARCKLGRLIGRSHRPPALSMPERRCTRHGDSSISARSAIGLSGHRARSADGRGSHARLADSAIGSAIETKDRAIGPLGQGVAGISRRSMQRSLQCDERRS